MQLPLVAGLQPPHTTDVSYALLFKQQVGCYTLHAYRADWKLYPCLPTLQGPCGSYPSKPDRTISYRFVFRISTDKRYDSIGSALADRVREIGRATCRERVKQSVDDESIKKK